MTPLCDADSFFADGPPPDPAMAAMPVTFHVGLHKTGSTWVFGRLIKPQHDVLLRVSNDEHITHRAFLLPPFGTYSEGRAHAELAGIAATARDKGLPLVIRDEALAGNGFGDGLPREVVALRIRRSFPRARVIVTIREQAALILSLYGHYVKSGFSSRLDQFLDPAEDSLIKPILHREAYHYDRMLTFYQSVFGADNVLVVPMEMAARDLAGTARQLGAFIGVDLPEPRDEGTARQKNPAWTWRALMTARNLNRFVPQDSRSRGRPGWMARKLSPLAVAHRLNAVEGRLGLGRDRGAIRAQVKAALGDHFAASNARFAAMTGLDLQALGYVTAAGAAPRPDTMEAAQ